MIDRVRGRRDVAPVRPAARRVYPNLSATRPPAVPGDLALWPWWADVPIEGLGFVALDADGAPVLARPEGGAS